MQSDWDSLFFKYTPHRDQMSHDERLLRDVGLTRLDTGQLALAEDPTRLVTVPNRPSSVGNWLHTIAALWSPRDTPAASRR
jgi:hypothetical protein